MQPQQSAYVLLVVISAMSAPTAWSAEACAPPPGFVDTPHPELAPIEALLSHTEENTIDQPTEGHAWPHPVQADDGM